MKRHLESDRYRLTPTEKKEIWARLTGVPTEGAAWHRRSLGPAMGLTAAVLILVVGGVWWQGSRVTGPTPAATDLAQLRAPASPERSTDREPTPAGAPAPTVLAESAGEPVPVPAAPAVPIPVTGRLVDAITGDPLGNASIAIAGTDRGLVSDADGRFDLGALQPGRHLNLAVNYLGYDPTTASVVVPDTGVVFVDLALQPVVVATLEAFDVDGAEYMVENQSAVREQVMSESANDQYAIDSVDRALKKESGVVSRAGELFVRGGRSRDFRQAAPSASPVPDPGMGGSVTGGTTHPNDEPYELMYFEHTGVNPFVATEDDALSTFAIDVDNASWTLARNYLDRGHLPPPEAIRVEEFVNSFEAGWAEQTAQPLVIHADGAPSRFGAGYHLLRVGLAGQHIDDSERKPANLVFVVDISGSMRQENRLGSVRHSLTLLLDELREGDRVGIVVYGSRGEVRLQPTDISRREVIQTAIDGLRPGGSTNAYEGLELAYRMARQHYTSANLNRLILCSDGVANNGASTEAGGILGLVRRATDEGITLSTVGFGMGNYNDVLMEKLADQGDGNYAYVDRREEAERVFRENLTGMLQTVARETKVQVEFDPARVARWRLLGYENRDIADRDFRNDDVDAGEVGAGHRVTALYEIKLIEPRDHVFPDDEGEHGSEQLGVVRLRWEAPAHDTARAGEVTEIERVVTTTDLSGGFAGAPRRLRVQAVVAEFAEILRNSYWAKGSDLSDLVPVADGLAAEMAADEQVRELARLVRVAAELAAADAEADASGR